MVDVIGIVVGIVVDVLAAGWSIQGIVEALRAMQSRPQISTLTAQALRVIGCLAYKSSSNQARLGELGACEGTYWA